jgi:hypothetical protein
MQHSVLSSGAANANLKQDTKMIEKDENQLQLSIFTGQQYGAMFADAADARRKFSRNS